MTLNGRERNWPVLDAAQQIKTTLIRENESETNLIMWLSEELGEVTLMDRDAAVHLLRFLKFWFNLPSPVFLTAANILDRFLTKMKVQQRYLSCLVISCFYVATKLHHCIIDPKTLVTLSQSKCSVKDMERMSEIVQNKLNINNENQLINVFYYLNQFSSLLETVAVQSGIKPFFDVVLKKELLFSHLEIIMCDAECASAKPSVIALALIQAEFERFYADEFPNKRSYYSFEMLQLLTTIVDLQLICLIVPVEFTSCHKKISQILKDYDDHRKLYHHQHLKWQYLSRTIYAIKPSQNYFNVLQPIVEE